jgi:hypothetical protein
MKMRLYLWRRPGEVLVKTIAVSINPIDWKLRSGGDREEWMAARNSLRFSAAISPARWWRLEKV